ncbi:hypothetical protein LUZ60_011700 [Juncus effusus]|nr:hypothetical protein LUZ60_011700 [Juncus effusus]
MVVLWLSAFLLLLILIILVIYQLITLSDLERDYINAYEAVSHINRAVFPEFALQLILCSLFLFTGHWFMLFSCSPFVYYSLKLYMQKQHMVHVADIYGMLEKEKTRRLIKLPMLFIPLCLSLFWLIWSCLEDDDFHLFSESDQLSHLSD